MKVVGYHDYESGWEFKEGENVEYGIVLEVPKWKWWSYKVSNMISNFAYRYVDHMPYRAFEVEEQCRIEESYHREEQELNKYYIWNTDIQEAIEYSPFSSYQAFVERYGIDALNEQIILNRKEKMDREKSSQERPVSDDLTTGSGDNHET